MYEYGLTIHICNISNLILYIEIVIGIRMRINWADTHYYLCMYEYPTRLDIIWWNIPQNKEIINIKNSSVNRIFLNIVFPHKYKVYMKINAPLLLLLPAIPLFLWNFNSFILITFSHSLRFSTHYVQQMTHTPHHHLPFWIAWRQSTSGSGWVVQLIMMVCTFNWNSIICHVTHGKLFIYFYLFMCCTCTQYFIIPYCT